MARPKQPKPKQQKQPTVKKLGKQAENAQFRSQLDALGLKIIQVTADGNCFFRALADQLEGNEEEYGKYRQMVVQYIMKHREEFEPFIEDDVPFDDYCKSMEKDGTWAGHMELQAASLVTQCNICIHRIHYYTLFLSLTQNLCLCFLGLRGQILSPRWYIQNFDNRGTRMIHLSYHDGEHYNSIHLKEDPGNGPARNIVIKADVDLSSTSHQSSKPKVASSQNAIDAAAVKIVMAGTGCQNSHRVEQVLQDLDGDIDAAIETLRAGSGSDENLGEYDELPSKDYTDDGHSENGNSDKAKATRSKEHDHGTNNDLQVQDGETSMPDYKKIPRNKACPCGSKKKYKSCCGSGTRKPLPEFAITQEITVRKGKKGRKQNKVGERLDDASSHRHQEDLPDMGALCI